MSDDLHDLVRQLRSEIEWAARVGVVDTSPARPVEATRSLEQKVEPPKARGFQPPKKPEARATEPRPEPRAPEPRASEPREPAKPAPRPVSTPPEVRRTLAEIRTELGDCTRCKLCQSRNKIVFGVGNERAELMFVGEGPGAEEDRQGEPFVGDAGHLLTKMIKAMGFNREDVYIANVVKCRPPGNRDPEPDEVAACEPFLAAQIASVSPKVIVALGRHATHSLLKTEAPITRLRGRFTVYRGVPLMPTYHPAYLLRKPEDKRLVWDDLKAVVAALGRKVPER